MVISSKIDIIVLIFCLMFFLLTGSGPITDWMNNLL